MIERVEFSRKWLGEWLDGLDLDDGSVRLHVRTVLGELDRREAAWVELCEIASRG